MMEPAAADRWVAVLRQEESHLVRLIELLQADQKAVALARPDDLAENVRRKEAVLAEMQVVVEARRGLLDALGRPPGGASRTFDEMAGELPPSHRGAGLESLERVRSLRASLAELNELTRRIMLHGLQLVRSTLGIIQGGVPVPVYGGNGDVRQGAAPTGRIVRQNA